jgi:hypothetical protein
MKMQDIRLLGKKLGLKSFGKTKAEFIREIQRAEGNFDCFGTAAGACDQLGCCFRSICLQPEKPVKGTRPRRASTPF